MQLTGTLFSACLILLLGSCKQRSGFSSASFTKADEQFSSKQSVRVYNQRNLELFTLGRNKYEVEKLMGPPNGRNLSKNGSYLWDYRRPVLNEDSQEIYDWSLVTFEFSQGICSSVRITYEHTPIQLLEETVER